MDNWKEIELLVDASKGYVLTDKEREMIASAEQEAFSDNFDSIKKVVDSIEDRLKKLNFWVENHLSKEGLRFRFTLKGYYGPGGISSQFHISGPLVLGELNPKGDNIISFYKNDIDLCHQIGCDYDEDSFASYLTGIIKEYLQPENLITSKEQYEHFRNLLED